MMAAIHELDDNERRLVLVGTMAGGTAVITYLMNAFLPLPDALGVAFFVARGPLMVTAFVGFHPFLAKPSGSGTALLATVFGVIAGAMTMAFAAVQMANLHYIGRFMAAADTPEAEELWRSIFRGVFTVQNGLNYVADFFLDWTGFLYAFVMWSHPRFGRLFAVASFALVGPHFVMKIISYPEPPAEAGLLDPGPLVSLWFAVVLIQVGRHLRRAAQ